jgi:hypothetical protein
MAFQLAPFLASAGLSVGQGIMANRAAKRQQERMEKEAAQAKLLQSFGANAQPTQGGMQGPSMAQQVMSDPLTQQLLTSLIGKGLSGIGGGQGGGVSGLQNPALLKQPTAPVYSTQLGQFKPQFGG